MARNPRNVTEALIAHNFPKLEKTVDGPSSRTVREGTIPKSPPKEKEKLRRGIGNRVGNAVHYADEDRAEEKRRERRERVHQLRIQNSMTWQDIGRELGIATKTAYADYERWKLEQPPSPLIFQIREEEEPKLLRNAQTLELARRTIIAQMTRVDSEGRDVVSADEKLQCSIALSHIVHKAVKVSESRRKLHGADMPVQHEVSGPNGGPIPVSSTSLSMQELRALILENEAEKKT